MKKNYIILICIAITIILGIIVGILITANNIAKPKQQIEQKLAKEKNGEEPISQIQTIQTAFAEEKTTPNTLLIFKTYYKQCEHTKTEKEEIPEQQVNKTKNELQENYKDWEIEKFEKNEVSLYKEQEGICNEHYLIKENNGYVAIYLTDSKGKESLQETTQIAIVYLPQADQQQLKEGIKVIGKEKLNATLEDYE